MVRELKKQVRTCITCGSTLAEGSTAFYCPNCGSAIIARCKRCRSLARPYKCPNCGFEGPRGDFDGGRWGARQNNARRA